MRERVEAALDATVREEYRYFDLHSDGASAVRDSNPEWPVYLAAHRHE